MELTIENFTKSVGHGNWYAEYTLIGKNLTQENVVEMLNMVLDDSDKKFVADGQYRKNESGYGMITFTIGKGDVYLIYRFTEVLHCIGYAEMPWCDDISVFCVKDGKDYDEGFGVEWQPGMPAEETDPDDPDIEDDEREFDCYVNIIDRTSGISFESGQGCVSMNAMNEIQSFIDSHCA